MWLCTSTSFLSVVADLDDKDRLLVRARVKGHIESIFPCADVFTDEHADYYYRALLPRKTVADAMAQSVESIQYPNFKDSVSNPTLHDAYLKVWEATRRLQCKPI